MIAEVDSMVENLIEKRASHFALIYTAVPMLRMSGSIRITGPMTRMAATNPGM